MVEPSGRRSNRTGYTVITVVIAGVIIVTAATKVVLNSKNWDHFLLAC